MTTTEHFDVLIVGAGLSGIGAGYHLQANCPRKTYAILEGREAIGGTWDLFRYPGIRSDSDMYTLGYSFRPWREAKAIADGPSILNYVRETAADYGIDKPHPLSPPGQAASWSSETATWTVEVARGETGETAQYTCGFLYMCAGYYNYAAGYTPDFAGVAELRRPCRASAILARRHRLCRQEGRGDRQRRHRRDFGAGDGQDRRPRHHAAALADLCGLAPGRGSDRQLAARQAAGHDRLRHHPLEERAADQMLFFNLARKKPEKTKERLIGMVREHLGPDYDVATHFTPRYNPWDQRLCLVPDADLFAALKDGSASVVTDHIETFTPTGLKLKSGATLDADVIVTATGLNMQLLSGMEIVVDGKVADLSKSMSYKGMMFSDVPNLASAFGYTNASWTLKADLTKRVCLQAAQPHGPQRPGLLRAAHRRGRHGGRAVAGLQFRLRPARHGEVPQAGRQEAVEGLPELRPGPDGPPRWAGSTTGR
jgi:monooxygenase